jgi:hypothetical protein
MAKRKNTECEVEEFSISAIHNDDKNACVSGVVVNISPIKQSKRNASVRYYDGKLSDGVCNVRFVLFNTGIDE